MAEEFTIIMGTRFAGRDPKDLAKDTYRLLRYKLPVDKLANSFANGKKVVFTIEPDQLFYINPATGGEAYKAVARVHVGILDADEELWICDKGGTGE